METPDNRTRSAATAAVTVGTRIHWNNHAQDRHVDVDKTLRQVLAFCARAATYADGIVIAVGLPQALAPLPPASRAVATPDAPHEGEFTASVRQFLTQLQGEIRDGVRVPAVAGVPRAVRIEIVPMLHWGSFVPALNAIIATATTQFPETSLLLLQSLEIEVDAAGVCFLQTRFEFGRDLVVGAALPGHAFQPRSSSSSASGATLELNGLTTPWNTLALWDLTRLAMVGFPLVGDGLKIDGAGTSCAGVEEVSTITLYQQLFPQTSAATVVQVPGIAWQVGNFESEERRSWQERKMASKLQRAETQMAHFGLPRGTVLHLQQQQ